VSWRKTLGKDASSWTCRISGQTLKARSKSLDRFAQQRRFTSDRGVIRRSLILASGLSPQVKKLIDVFDLDIGQCRRCGAVDCCRRATTPVRRSRQGVPTTKRLGKRGYPGSLPARVTYGSAPKPEQPEFLTMPTAAKKATARGAGFCRRSQCGLAFLFACLERINASSDQSTACQASAAVARWRRRSVRY
jgi:hypothetical protein